MPFRSRATLESWLTEFSDLGNAFSNAVQVIDQDGSEGADTGLIQVRLSDVATVTYLQQDEESEFRWLATFESREAALVLDAAEVAVLSTDLAMIAALCAFLQAKSLGTEANESY